MSSNLSKVDEGCIYAIGPNVLSACVRQLNSLCASLHSLGQTCTCSALLVLAKKGIAASSVLKSWML